MIPTPLPIIYVYELTPLEIPHNRFVYLLTNCAERYDDINKTNRKAERKYDELQSFLYT